MLASWRWFGPTDPVPLDHIRQAGATDVVTALYDIPAGEEWPLEEILALQATIEDTPKGLTPLKWSTVESVPVHEDIKLGLEGSEKYVDAFIRTVRNLATAGINIICYNFMPVIDWTRTDLEFDLPSGAKSLKFDQTKFMAFDLFILKRPCAENDYTPEEREAAADAFDLMSASERQTLSENITAGLPGRMTDTYGLDDFKKALARYDHIDANKLRANLYNFLEKVLPEAERVGVKLAIHPDDPPRSLLGLPRIICTSDDLSLLFQELPSPSNGVTLCAGTFGTHPDNDLPTMAKRFADRIYFTHLRGVTKDSEDPRNFVEAAHLESDVDIVALVRNLLLEEGRRREQDGADMIPIPFRPDHGHQMMDDLHKKGNPGYSAIGRLKGLSEIRGIIKTLEQVIR